MPYGENFADYLLIQSMIADTLIISTFRWTFPDFQLPV
jgi:hypothetical protein